MARFTPDKRPEPIRCGRCGKWFDGNDAAEVSKHLNCQIQLAQEIDLERVHDLQRGRDQARYLGP